MPQDLWDIQWISSAEHCCIVCKQKGKAMKSCSNKTLSKKIGGWFIEHGFLTPYGMLSKTFMEILELKNAISKIKMSADFTA